MKGLTPPVLIVLAALFAAALQPLAALGHALSPALLEITEQEGGTYLVRVKQPVKQLSQPPLHPKFPPHCRNSGAAREQVTPSYRLVEFSLHCDPPGLAGQLLAVPALVANNTSLVLSLRLAGGARHTLVMSPDNSEITVPVASGGWRVFPDYFRLGVTHLATGLDHLMFLAALVLLVQRAKPLALVVTAFTVGHAMSVVLTTLGVLSAPSFLVEIFIALSIVLLSVDVFFRDIRTRGLGYTAGLCLAFGLLHGMGFASALDIADLGRVDKAIALLGFNLGIEAIQLVVVTLTAVLMHVMFTTLRLRHPGFLKLSACLLGAAGSLWFWERLLASVSILTLA